MISDAEFGTLLASARKMVFDTFASMYGSDEGADPDDWEDAIQEGMVKAWRHRRRFDPQRARFSTWLFHICRNCLRDLLDSKAYAENVRHHATWWVENVLVDPDPDETLRAEVARLEDTLLDDVERKVWRRCIYRGESRAKASRNLGLSKTVGHYAFHRAKAKLADALQGKETDHVRCQA